MDEQAQVEAVDLDEEDGLEDIEMTAEDIAIIEAAKARAETLSADTGMHVIEGPIVLADGRVGRVVVSIDMDDEDEGDADGEGVVAGEGVDAGEGPASA